MSRSLKNYLSLNKLFLLGSFVLLFNLKLSSQIANYVNNGGFENYYHDLIWDIPYYWSALDSSKWYGELLTSPGKVPLSGYGFQLPHGGKNYLGTNPFTTNLYNNRGYPRNRLKGTLDNGRIYCVKMHVSLTNQSTHGIDAVGAYFGNNSLDTITQCDKAITYLIPQIFNPNHNILIDTLQWISITGTFVANGTEKYMLIGNFKTNSNTDTLLSNPTNLPAIFSNYLIDNVSCIDLDLPAYAGPDKNVIAGDSVYIGRESDVEIDESCIWYQMTSPTTSITIDTIAGIWVKPVATTTYVVRQQLWCSGVKWDTVVVHMDYVGLEEQNLDKQWDIDLFPNPAKNKVVFTTNIQIDKAQLIVQDLQGRVVLNSELFLNSGTSTIDLDLTNGVYFITFTKENNEQITKKLFIAK